MAFCRALFLCLINTSLFVSLSFAADPFAFYQFEVSYITASPLGVPQQVGFLDPSFPLCNSLALSS